ncbi:hypothetical protein SLA2020_466370 [Shorea laevis]
MQEEEMQKLRTGGPTESASVFAIPNSKTLAGFEFLASWAWLDITTIMNQSVKFREFWKPKVGPRISTMQILKLSSFHDGKNE